MCEDRDAKIIRLLRSGLTYRVVAERFGLSEGYVNDLKRMAEFKEANPELATGMNQRLLQSAATLWSHGYSIARRA